MCFIRKQTSQMFLFQTFLDTASNRKQARWNVNHAAVQSIQMVLLYYSRCFVPCSFLDLFAIVAVVVVANLSSSPLKGVIHGRYITPAKSARQSPQWWCLTTWLNPHEPRDNAIASLNQVATRCKSALDGVKLLVTVNCWLNRSTANGWCQWLL